MCFVGNSSNGTVIGPGFESSACVGQQSASVTHRARNDLGILQTFSHLYADRLALSGSQQPESCSLPRREPCRQALKIGAGMNFLALKSLDAILGPHPGLVGGASRRHGL